MSKNKTAAWVIQQEYLESNLREIWMLKGPLLKICFTRNQKRSGIITSSDIECWSFIMVKYMYMHWCDEEWINENFFSPVISSVIKKWELVNIKGEQTKKQRNLN